MDEKDLKAIQKIVKEEIKPLRVDLDSVKMDLSTVKEDLGTVKEEQGTIKEDLKEIKETVDANNVSLIKLENTIGLYSDALDIERKRIDKHDERLEVIEESPNLNL
jgi:chromosome segregation ATPase